MEYTIAEQTNTELKMQKEFYESEMLNMESLLENHKNQVREQETRKNGKALDLLKTDIDKKQQQYDQMTTVIQENKYLSDSLNAEILNKEKIIEEQISTLRNLKSERDILLDEVTTLNNRKQEIEKTLSECVDDALLFHWMSVAIRLDYLMHNKSSNPNIDRQAMYEFLKQNKIPYTAWPKKILSEIIGHKKK